MHLQYRASHYPSGNKHHLESLHTTSLNAPHPTPKHRTPHTPAPHTAIVHGLWSMVCTLTLRARPHTRKTLTHTLTPAPHTAIVHRLSSIVLALALCAGLPLVSTAQQNPVFTNYTQQPLMFNPAAAGVDSAWRVALLTRGQWFNHRTYGDAGTAPAGRLQSFTAEHALRDSAGGLGLTVYVDQAGPMKQGDVKLSYAYHIHYNAHGTLGMGLGAGYHIKSLDYDEFIVKHPDDAYLGNQRGNVSQLEPDLSFGLWMNHTKYYLGISYAHFLDYAYEDVHLPDEPVLTLTGGYRIPVNPRWSFNPGFLMINEADEVTVAVHSLLAYEDVFQGGVVYRHEEAVSFLVNTWLLQSKALQVGVSGDLITKDQDAKGGASFEVLLGARF